MAKPTAPAIEISGLKKSFGDHQVMKGINLTVDPGESLVVLGKSGSGKSLIIKCIVRLIRPDSGVIRIHGQDMGELDEAGLLQARRRIGFLFQSGALYDSMTVRENLEFPLRGTGEDVGARVIRALESVDLLSSIDKMPSELSGGMRKRLGLARTLILEPRIMLYDEPTTGLDLITSKDISRLMLDVQARHKTSSIIITHDLECARLTSNRIVVLKEGEIIEEGSFEGLQKSNDPFVRSFFG